MEAPNSGAMSVVRGLWEYVVAAAAWPGSFFAHGGSQRHFSFIKAHYIWIVGMTLIGSVVLYGAGRGNIAYIDALFFSSGASTQAGLNTVDLINLTIFQQVVIYLLAMASNPITINTSVVFLRLYWFEKHFQTLVREARQRRSTISRSRAKDGLDEAEQGDATVARSAGADGVAAAEATAAAAAAAEGTRLDRSPSRASGRASSRNNSSNGDDDEDDGENNTNTASTPRSGGGMTHPNDTESTKIAGANHRDGGRDDGNTSPGPRDSAAAAPPPPVISFAKTVRRSDGETDGTNFSKRSAQDHIAILERQRNLSNANDGEVLRIPNPRDAEKGVRPKPLELGDPHDDDDDDNGATATASNATAAAAAASAVITPATPGHTRIAFQEPIGRRDLKATAARPPPSEGAATAAAPAAFSEKQPPMTLVRRLTTFRSTQRRRRDELKDDVTAIGNVFAPSLRVSRFWSRHDEGPATIGGGHVRGASNGGPIRGPIRGLTFMDIKKTLSRDRTDGGAGVGGDMPYLSWTPTEAGQMGRNSNFHGLTLEQREELGGIEYRSLRTLAMILVSYFWGLSILIVVCLIPYIYRDRDHREILENQGIGLAWWSIFTANSAFSDLGFTLTPDNMISFQDSAFPLLVMALFVFAGNSAFPVMLRFSIWLFSLAVPKTSGLWDELQFLLDHPRRCFTMLFPSSANWWLFFVLCLLNGIDLVLFIILDLHSKAVDGLGAGERIANGIFIAASTRTAGFASVNLADLHPAVQTSYMVMMYISVFPIAISIRRTNVYEEKSLGIIVEQDDDAEATGTVSFIGNHLRRQLSFDLWYVFAGLFILAISEGNKIISKDFDLFAILFEVVSAYGTVGLSLGYPGVNASLSSQFSTVGKLVIIAMQIRGRHRGLPYGLDRAVLLPSEERLHETEELQPVVSLVQAETQEPAQMQGAALDRTTSIAFSTGTATGHQPQRRPTVIVQRRRRRSSAIRPSTPFSGGGLARSMSRSMTSMMVPGPPPPLPPPRTSRGSRSSDRRPLSFDRRIVFGDETREAVAGPQARPPRDESDDVAVVDDYDDGMSAVSPRTTRNEEPWGQGGGGGNGTEYGEKDTGTAPPGAGR